MLGAIRDPEKIRTERITGNHFNLLIRDVPDVWIEDLLGLLEFFRSRRMPNRFGKPRFGKFGDNSRRGREILFGVVRGLLEGPVSCICLAACEVFNRTLGSRGVCDQSKLGDGSWTI